LKAYSFDLIKSERNRLLRGIDFAIVVDFEWDSALILQDLRQDYLEDRFQALGFIVEHLHMLVFTQRGADTCDQPAKSQPKRKKPLCRANPILN
jgi:uncharacterized DUF497 family protein